MRSRNSEFIFPRDVLGRIALFVASAFFSPLFGFCAYAVFGRPIPATLEGWIVSAVVSQLALSGTLFFVTGLVWSLFAPRWLETLVIRCTRNFILSLGVFVLLSFPYAIWAISHA